MKTITRKYEFKHCTLIEKRAPGNVDFKAFFETIPGLYLILLPDENFTIAAINNSYAAATLANRDEIAGIGVFDFLFDNPNILNTDGISKLHASLNNVLKLKKTDIMPPLKYGIRQPLCGNEKWEVRYGEMVNIPVFDRNYNLLYIINQLNDITELVKANQREQKYMVRAEALEKSEKLYIEKFKESENHFRHLTQDVIDYSICMIDVKGNILSWNSGAEKIKKYTANEVLGKNISMFYEEGDRQAGLPEENLALALEKGRHEVEGWRLRKDQSLYWANVIYTPVYNEKGEHTGFSQITRDITEHKLQDEEIKNASEIIARKNKDITDSITYARRIQSAILPDEAEFTKYFPESFILYKPKDIVSGDFYWFTEHDGKFIIVVGDCTGHGVPGSLLSMIGYDLLRDTVHLRNITDPAGILTEMDNGFHTIFEIGKHAEIINDGMDIAICTYDNRALTLTFSSAKRPLYIIRGNILTEIKGSSSPIGGGYYFKYPYTNKNLKLEEKDRYFMFTDGFADQFGGDKLKKLKTAGFKDLLIKFSEQKMSAYKEALNNYFEEWKRTEEQTDDVLVLGFEINKTHY